MAKSLARKTVTSQDIIGTWYSVHNLQLTFLQEQSANLNDLHKRIVDRYRRFYKGEYNSGVEGRGCITVLAFAEYVLVALSPLTPRVKP